MMALETGRTVPEPLDRAVADAFRADDQSIDDLPIGVLVFLDGDVVRVNDGWTSLTGLTLSQSQGSRWLAAVHADDRAHAEAVPRLAFAGTDAAGDWRLVRPRPNSAQQVEDVWVHARVRHAKTVNVRTCVVTLTEIATHKANELRLMHLATHDPLTGLPNRDAFVQRVDAALARAARDHVTALLFVDLDRFKQVNDHYGHLCGDRLLVAVARRLRSTLRPFDTLGRLGGDELGIVCEVATAQDATRLAGRVVEATSEPFIVEEQRLRIGASVGVATASPGAPTSSEQLIADADHAMYRAKQAGGGQWSMSGAPESSVGGRRAAEEAHSSLAELGADTARLRLRVAQLQKDISPLDDERLEERLREIASALERARELTVRHDIR